MEEYKHFAELQFDSDEEEIHLLKIPKDIDPNVLLHAKLDLTKKSKVKAQSEIFHLEPISDKCEPTYFLGPNGLKKVEPSSVLLLTKSVSKKNIKGGLNHFLQLEGENKKEAVVPIDSIKKRHPLFGDKYKAKVELQDEIKQKLMEAIHSFDKNEKNSKRKKKQVVDNEEYDDKSLLISQILQTKFKSKKSTNVENTEDLDSCPTTSENLASSLKEKTKKKKKHKNEYSSLTESSIYLENMSKDMKKELQSDHENLESTPNERKKKKRRRDSEASFPSLDLNNSFMPPAKKRRPSLLSSTVIKDGSPEFKPNLSVILGN